MKLADMWRRMAELKRMESELALDIAAAIEYDGPEEAVSEAAPATTLPDPGKNVLEVLRGLCVRASEQGKVGIIKEAVAAEGVKKIDAMSEAGMLMLKARLEAEVGDA